MKRYISPATVIATVALFITLGGSSLAAANYIDGASIKPNSIPANRLTRSAIAVLRGNRVTATAPIATGTSGLGTTVQAHFVATFVKLKAGMPNTPQLANMACPNGEQLAGGGFDLQTGASPNGDPSKFILIGSSPKVSSPSVADWHWAISGFYRDANANHPPLEIMVFASCLRGA